MFTLVIETKRGVIPSHCKETVWNASVAVASDGYLLLMMFGQHVGANRFNLNSMLYKKRKLMFTATSMPS